MTSSFVSRSLAAVAALMLPFPAAVLAADKASGTVAAGAAAHNPGQNTPHGNEGQHRGALKHLKIVTLPQSELREALSDQKAVADKLKAMKTIDISKLQIAHVGSATTQSGSGQMSGSSAGTTQSGSSNSPSGGNVTTGTGGLSLNNSQIQYLHNVLANINVSDALNNVTVSLSNVLNNNNISIGQVLGIYLGPGGSVTAITQ
jgi:hypothetical protein